MEESLERELSRSARTNQPVALLLLDIDHFKQINDTFGHQGGDALLRALGEFLIQRTRAQDVACRYGGEEFAIILSGANQETAAQRAKILRDDLKHMIVEHAGRIVGQITFSIGIAVSPEHGTSATELLRAADASLYRAKDQGRDCIVVA
jgi:diguanylate cyclase (GGDEF)-like protein